MLLGPLRPLTDGNLGMVGKVPDGGKTLFPTGSNEYWSKKGLKGTANGKIVDPTPKAKVKGARRARKTKARQADELRRLWRLALGLPMP